MGITYKSRRPHPVYRSVATLHGAWSATVVLIGVIILAAIPGREQIAGCVLAPLWLLATWRAWRMGVYLEAGGVKVVGALISRRLAWEEVERFEVRAWHRYPYTGYVVLRDARPAIPLKAITTGGGKNERHQHQAQAPIDQLNEALAAWKQANTVAAVTVPTDEQDYATTQPSAEFVGSGHDYR
jgi:hypothetical protein